MIILAINLVVFNEEEQVKTRLKGVWEINKINNLYTGSVCVYRGNIKKQLTEGIIKENENFLGFINRLNNSPVRPIKYKDYIFGSEYPDQGKLLTETENLVRPLITYKHGICLYKSGA